MENILSESMNPKTMNVFVLLQFSESVFFILHPLANVPAPLSTHQNRSGNALNNSESVERQTYIPRKSNSWSFFFWSRENQRRTTCTLQWMEDRPFNFIIKYFSFMRRKFLFLLFIFIDTKNYSRITWRVLSEEVHYFLSRPPSLVNVCMYLLCVCVCVSLSLCLSLSLSLSSCHAARRE